MIGSHVASGNKKRGWSWQLWPVVTSEAGGFGAVGSGQGAQGAFLTEIIEMGGARLLPLIGCPVSGGSRKISRSMVIHERSIRPVTTYEPESHGVGWSDSLPIFRMAEQVYVHGGERE